MLKEISEASTTYLQSRNVIPEDKRQIYQYGFNVIYSTLFCFVSIAVIGIIWHRTWETLIFLIYFVILRQAVGGYHADTYQKCFLLTNLVFILECILAVMIADKPIIAWGFFLFSTFYMVIKAPSPNPHRKVKESRRQLHRRRALICLAGSVISMVLFQLLGFTVIIPEVAATITMIAGMMYINKTREV